MKHHSHHRPPDVKVLSTQEIPTSMLVPMSSDGSRALHEVGMPENANNWTVSNTDLADKIWYLMELGLKVT